MAYEAYGLKASSCHPLTQGRTFKGVLHLWAFIFEDFVHFLTK